MGIFRTITDFASGRRHTVKKYIESQQQYYLKRVELLKDGFSARFYEQIIHCAASDAYEYFLESKSEHQLFYQNIPRINTKTGEAFYKWVAMYHTLAFIKQKGSKVDKDTLMAGLYLCFDFSADEVIQCQGYETLMAENKSLFEVTFSKDAVYAFFGLEQVNQQGLSFVFNFFLNSYQDFLNSFTRYVSINSRTKVKVN